MIYRYNELRCNDISWWYIVSLCEISFQQILARPISRLSRRDIAKIVPISRWFIVLAFVNPCDLSLIYQREIAKTNRDIHRLLFALLLHSTVGDILRFKRKLILLNSEFINPSLHFDLICDFGTIVQAGGTFQYHHTKASYKVLHWPTSDQPVFPG